MNTDGLYFCSINAIMLRQNNYNCVCVQYCILTWHWLSADFLLVLEWSLGISLSILCCFVVFFPSSWLDSFMLHWLWTSLVLSSKFFCCLTQTTGWSNSNFSLCVLVQLSGLGILTENCAWFNNQFVMKFVMSSITQSPWAVNIVLYGKLTLSFSML